MLDERWRSVYHFWTLASWLSSCFLSFLFFWSCLSIFLCHIWLPKLACRAWAVWQASLKFQSHNREASPGTEYMEVSEPVKLQWEMAADALCGKIFVSRVNSSVVRAGFEVQSIIKQRPLLPHLPVIFMNSMHWFSSWTTLTHSFTIFFFFLFASLYHFASFVSEPKFF